MKASQPPAPAAPPRSKRRGEPARVSKQSPTRNNQYDDGYYDRGGAGGFEEDYAEEVVDIMTLTPETTVGEHVAMEGKLKFFELLRIDGEFKGTFEDVEGQGHPPSLIIGRTGHLTADVKDMNTMVVDGGVVVGNISVERLKLLGTAAIHGNVTCKSLVVEENATIVGQLNVNPQAPLAIDETGNVKKATPAVGEGKPPAEGEAKEESGDKAA